MTLMDFTNYYFGLVKLIDFYEEKELSPVISWKDTNIMFSKYYSKYKNRIVKYVEIGQNSKLQTYLKIFI